MENVGDDLGVGVARDGDGLALGDDGPVKIGLELGVGDRVGLGVRVGAGLAGDLGVGLGVALGVALGVSVGEGVAVGLGAPDDRSGLRAGFAWLGVRIERRTLRAATCTAAGCAQPTTLTGPLSRSAVRAFEGLCCPPRRAKVVTPAASRMSTTTSAVTRPRLVDGSIGMCARYG
ncbi:MAG: hypothetical protein QOJ79_1088 [Actinomycetota bacterium]|nr:hypothetical protein [Actinomycetota bacterium]